MIEPDDLITGRYIAVPVLTLSMLVEHAINELWYQSQEEAPFNTCCANCCGPCAALVELITSDMLDDVMAVRGWKNGDCEWWVDGAVDRELLNKVILFSCEQCRKDS